MSKGVRNPGIGRGRKGGERRGPEAYRRLIAQQEAIVNPTPGQKLRLLRLKKGLSMQAAAKLIGVSCRLLFKAEHDEIGVGPGMRLLYPYFGMDAELAHAEAIGLKGKPRKKIRAIKSRKFSPDSCGQDQRQCLFARTAWKAN